MSDDAIGNYVGTNVYAGRGSQPTFFTVGQVNMVSYAASTHLKHLLLHL